VSDGPEILVRDRLEDFEEERFSRDDALIMLKRFEIELGFEAPSASSTLLSLLRC
jgi:hypothetical protein